MDSKLQIISGKYRGRKLFLSPDARPTQSCARIALFNMLSNGMVDFNRDGLVIWDAFAGTGVLGLETLSRATNATAIFTDLSDTSLETINRNIQLMGLGTITKTEKIDAITALNKYANCADIIFVDPPYNAGKTGAIFVDKAGRLVKDGTVLIWEQDTHSEMFEPGDIWNILRDKRYGRARFLILEKCSVKNP